MTPHSYGMPSRFHTWREGQAEAFLSQMDPDPRFLIQNCPTGAGKSVVYMTAAKASGGRTVILTSTKGLQTQLANEFGRIKGFADIRGRSNYTCRLHSKVTCDYGVCTYGVNCPYREEGGCPYYDDVKLAKAADIVVTNYAYWMAQCEYSTGLGEFDRLVLDEAHAAPDHLLSFLAVTLRRSNKFEARILKLTKNALPRNLAQWAEWADSFIWKIQDTMETAKQNRHIKQFVQSKRLLGKLSLMADMDPSWVHEDDGDSLVFTPTWPAPYSGKLFQGIPKVLLTSATVVPKTARLLGIPKGESRYEEYPATFPVENRRLIHVPTIRMNYRNTPADDRIWLVKGDSIIRPRLERKGIIHTVSYKRRDLVMEKSKFKQYMITHNTRDVEEVVARFKASPPPLILVSPSMATGWDFPYDECRWQWIVKLPFPDTRGAVMKRRVTEDKQYQSYLVAQLLIQAVGRGVRAIDDWCETFITDDNVQWFLQRNKRLTAEWFHGAYLIKTVVPRPKEIL